MSPLPVLSPEQSRTWDDLAGRAGIAPATLMAVAGRAVAEILVLRYASAAARGVLVAAGSGNNGGDGWVAARALHRAGLAVWVASPPGERSPLCADAAALAATEGVRELPPDGPWPAIGIVVDALLGTGARGAPRPPIAALLQRMADLSVPVVAVDGPTGVDLATGVVHGAARADMSITFGGVGRGHLLARDECGAVIVADIGHPPSSGGWPWLVTDAPAAQRMPPFHSNFHKGNRGRVVVVGGAAAMVGAARMVARAAFATGAGLVHVAAPAAALAALRTAEPDVQTIEQDFDASPSAALLELLGQADAVVLGPGLGRNPAQRTFAADVIRASSTVVLDADGLVLFQGAVPELSTLCARSALVLTPHPGEFRTLFPDLAAGAETDPWQAAADASDRAGAVVLLKGVPSVIAAPGRAPATVAAGNPGLATGGSGDLLSGIIGALLAQGVDRFDATWVGAQALGRAADIAARRHGARSMRPVDVVAALPDLWHVWEVLRRAPAVPRLPILLELSVPAGT